MDQFVSILLSQLFASVVHQIMLYTTAHEQVIIMFVIRCKNFAMLIFKEKTYIIDVLIKISLFTLFKDILTTIIDRIRLNLVRIKKVGCVWNINSEITVFGNDFGQSVDAGHEIQFLCVIIYIIMQIINASLLITIVLIEFGVFIPEFIFNPAGFSYKLIIIVDLKRMILLTKKQLTGQENKEQAFWTQE